MVNPLDIGNRPPPYHPMGSSTTTTATLMGMSCGPASAAAVFLDRYARCMSEWLSTKLLMLTSTVRLLLKKKPSLNLQGGLLLLTHWKIQCLFSTLK